jgi:Fe/S biogenesis protein NfuA
MTGAMTIRPATQGRSRLSREFQELKVMVTFTDKAREMVLSFMDQSEGELQALRINLRNGSPLAPGFELTLVSAEDAAPEDVSLDGGGFKVLLDPESASGLEGATVDFVERLNESGFELKTPARKNVAPVDRPTGAIAEKVQEILDQQVNPSIAAHGGQINLVDVKGTELYMEMTGGCQGCAMSRLTLRQGVERMIRQAIPEITEIHDITDHDSGENPFFT